MQNVSLVAGTLISILAGRGFAEVPQPSTSTDTKEANRQTSQWGPAENGLQLRVVAPNEIEQGMPLALKLDFQQQAGGQAGIARLNSFLRDEYLKLILTDTRQNQTRSVKPLDPTAGMPPPPDLNRSSLPLDGSALTPWEVQFPLVVLYDELKPGTYTARVRFRFPEQPSPYWRGTQADWERAGFWYGTLVSGPIRLQLQQETPRTKTLTVPKHLRFRTERVQLRADDTTTTAIPAVYFDKRDAETIKVPVRNGHSIGVYLYRDGEQITLSGDLLRTGSPNALDAWYDYKGGIRQATYTIEVFETGEHPRHLWMPGPGAAGYKTMWKQTFRVSYSRQEL